MEPDFTGYATKYGVKCKDGRTIMPNAFAHQSDLKVPLVWSHGSQEHENVMGHVFLRTREDGVYCEGYFNDTAAGKNGKNLVAHGDLDALSIWANDLVEKTKNVVHGMIREVSLCMFGANPDAKIDYVQIEHSDGEIETPGDVAIIFSGESLAHSDDGGSSSVTKTAEKTDEGRTLQEIYDGMDAEERGLLEYMVDSALKGEGSNSDKGGDAQHAGNSTEGDLQHKEGGDMTGLKHNVFDGSNGKPTGTGTGEENTLSHSQMSAMVADHGQGGPGSGTLKESMLKHAGEYGIQNLEVLFPEAQVVDNIPELISRSQEWVNTFMSGSRKSPISRIKTLHVSITHEEARANGYLKGNYKKEEFFKMVSRKTQPTTIYKKQRLDRDDIIDITTMDVVSFLWGEMRIMFNEELARAGLLGDGRSYDDVDKVDDECIRPIVTENEFFTHTMGVDPITRANSEEFVEQVVRSRKYYRGTGNPVMFTTEDNLTTLLLSKDDMGRRLYNSETELNVALRVSKIVTVELMEDYVLPDGHPEAGKKIAAVYFNLSDYWWGTDRGGELAKFDDFDIDYNQYKYMMEGRTSAALTKFKSAVVFVEGGTTDVERYPEALFDQKLAPEKYLGSQRNVTGRGGVDAQGRTVPVVEAPKAPQKVGNTVAFQPGEGYHWTIDGAGNFAPGSSVQQTNGQHAYAAVADNNGEFVSGTQRNFTLTFS